MSEKSFSEIFTESWNHTKSVYVQTYIAGTDIRRERVGERERGGRNRERERNNDLALSALL